MTLAISLDSSLPQITADGMQFLWRALGHNKSLPQPSAAVTSLNAVEVSDREFSNIFSRSLAEASILFSAAKKGTATEKIFPGSINELQRDKRLDLTTLLLSANISKIISDKKDSLKLPVRCEKDLGYWMSVTTDWYLAERYEGYGGLPFNPDHSVESSVRWSIENSWRNLQKDYWQETMAAEVPGLKWENTAFAAVNAIYTNINSLEQAFDEEKFSAICQKLHEQMIKHNLWGNDSRNPDRANQDGHPKPFAEVSRDMQRNYILITIAALNGIADFMAQPQHVSPK